MSSAWLQNLGPKSTQWLSSVGIKTLEDLQEVGPVEAFLAVKQKHARASLNLLWALAAGLDGIDWRELSEARKQGLIDQLGELA